MKLFFTPKWRLSLLVLLLLAAACGPAANRDADGDTETPADTAVAESESEADTGSEAEAEDESEDATTTTTGDAAGSTTTASGLQYIEEVAGTGPAPQPGDIVSVHYTGTLEDGTQFDSSIESGQPFQFTLGQGQVIPGWDEGIALMREGGKGTLIVPPELAYGPNGAGSLIPPNATLIFEVELVEVQPQPKPVAVEEADYSETESGLKYYFLEEGEGTAVQEGDLVSIDVELWYDDGTLLQSSIQRGAPIDFVLGSEGSLPGLDEALVLMQEGDKIQLVMPATLAGGGETDPDLIFEIRLLETGQPPKPLEVDEEDYTVTESGLKFYEIEAGSGPAPQTGDLVSVHYQLWLEDGTLIDSSVAGGQPFQFVIGGGGTIPGWEEGVMLMQEGGKAQFVVPSELGYGPSGSGPIPPDATLIFELEVLEVQSQAGDDE